MRGRRLPRGKRAGGSCDDRSRRRPPRHRRCGDAGRPTTVRLPAIRPTIGGRGIGALATGIYRVFVVRVVLD